jgi:hypothetical protein
MNVMGALMKAKIRGIYSTALTRLLLDNGFEIAQPSLAIKKRFGLSDDSEPPDIRIKDRYDLQGIRALGTVGALDTFQYILHSTFEDVLTRRWRVTIDGIYCGKATGSDEDTVYVDVGSGIIGRLSKHEFAGEEDKPFLVQVERKKIGARQPILTTELKIVGNYAILVRNSKVGVSLRIRDLNKRAELYALGKTLAPEGWGIIWRESSAKQPKETLSNAVKELVEKIRILNEKAMQANAPALLIEGLGFMDVEFPYFSKKSLDKLRGSAAQTLEGHHFYKCCEGNVSAALEMAETLLERGQDRADVEESFRKQMVSEFPEAGFILDIEHVKLSGLVFHLGQARVESSDTEKIIYSRVIRSAGFYDGLGVKKEAGDKAESHAKIGEWYIATKYFSQNGDWKGTYINLNTPIEIYPKAIRYIDLEIDVCIGSDSTTKVLDAEKLEQALENGYVSRKLFEMTREKTRELTEGNVT